MRHLKVRTLVMAMALTASAAPADAQDGPVQRARETARIGEGQRAEFSFGTITGLAIDGAGHLYVSDAQDNRVVVFDATGRHLATIGRKGQGPGEFQHPSSLGIAKDGSLWVREVNRVQRFVPERAGGPATKYAGVVGALTMVDWMSTRTGVLDRDGLFHVPVAFGKRDKGFVEHVQLMLRVDSAGRVVDSLKVPWYENAPPLTASYMVSANSGRMLAGLNHVPFAPVPRWASSPSGGIISGDGLAYELRETDATGRAVRTFKRTYAPVPIDAAERRDSLRALEARIDSIPVPHAQVLGMPEDVSQRKLPTHYPAFREIAVSSEGDVWVRRWTTAADRGTSRYDVFAPDARFGGTMVLPAELVGAPTLVVRGRWAAGVMTDPETGLQSVVRFEFRMTAAPESSPRPRP
jgi:hypothetical protein